MTRRRWLLVTIAAILVSGLVFTWWSAKPRTVVIIENQSETTVDLAVETTNPSSFSWNGELKPGQRVSELASFSDNSFVATCEEAGISKRHTGGYVTNGLSQRVEIIVESCSSLNIDVQIAS